MFFLCYSSSAPVHFCKAGGGNYISETPLEVSKHKFYGKKSGTEQKVITSEGNVRAILAASKPQLKVNECFSKSQSDIPVRCDYVKKLYVNLPSGSNKTGNFISKCKGRAPPER